MFLASNLKRPSFRLRSFPRPLAPSVTSSPPSQGGDRSSSKSIYTNSRFTAFMRPASNHVVPLVKDLEPILVLASELNEMEGQPRMVKEKH